MSKVIAVKFDRTAELELELLKRRLNTQSDMDIIRKSLKLMKHALDKSKDGIVKIGNSDLLLK